MMNHRSSIAVVAAFLTCAASATLAQGAPPAEAIPTAAAPGAGAPQPAAPPPPLQPPEREPLAGPGPAYGPCGPLRRKPDGTIAPPSQQAHGEVSAAVGNHGYREAGGVVCQPIGDHAAVQVGVDLGRWGGRR